jgi:hypothetical protein
VVSLTPLLFFSRKNIRFSHYIKSLEDPRTGLGTLEKEEKTPAPALFFGFPDFRLVTTPIEVSWVLTTEY